MIKLQIKSFVFKASNGGKSSCKNLAHKIAISLPVLKTKSINKEKLWLKKYIIIETIIVKIVDIKVDKKSTIETKVISFKSININEKIISGVIEIPLKNKTPKNKIDCKTTIKEITQENQKNFHKINSYLLIGFDNIKNIVFHSISLNNNWLQTNKTQINQNISIIEIPKSTITFSSSQIVSLPKASEKTINKSQKITIIYKNLFLTISLNVFNAIFIISLN